MFTNRQRGTSASTLVEMLVSLAVGSIVGIAIMSFAFFTGRSFSALTNYNDLDDKSRNALDTLTRDIRQVIELDAFTSNAVATTLDLRATNGIISYVYSPTNRTLMRISATGDRSTLLAECDTLKFGLYQRNPVGGTYNQYPASTNNLSVTCKLIQVSWTCSRKILGNTMNSESVQTAKVVMRNQ